jgi:hypothetical protein
MLKLDRGRFTIVRQQPQEQPAQTPVQDVRVQYVEVPTYQPKPDPSTYMVLSTRKIDGVTVQTVSDRKTGNIYVITLS